MRILITGGYGFIGSTLIKYLLEKKPFEILNVDCQTYAADTSRLLGYEELPNYTYKNVDIFNYDDVYEALSAFKPDIVMNLAAETHVDNSIISPKKFIDSNILGTYNLLEACRNYLTYNDLNMYSLRFHQISTDEVYGDLTDASSNCSMKFNEETAYCPSSPYSAAKSSADHLVRAWGRTFGLQTLVSTCTNNYGPFQHGEKLIPTVIKCALKGNEIPVYGSGKQIRDWLHVSDHVRALVEIAQWGKPGETYAIGARNERTNIDVIHSICNVLDELCSKQKSYRNQIKYVDDRPGHDAHYAIDPSKIEKVLKWTPLTDFDAGLRQTVQWYVERLMVEQ